nr:site-specific DNA-methyltransferase [Rhabdothermincola salaria]
MDAVADGSVALVVTSPPYFAGKQYEEELARDGVPASYLEYLEMLRDVFAECARVLEPGGRIAVNVANLGRKPYRSLSADVIRILQDDLGLLLRGEVVWQKAEGASGSCAWGSYRSATNPVLRDITERIVIASKGRFDRALSAKKRQTKGLPHRSTIGTDDFMALTLDVWSIPPESARRVGHPAPFPVELPEKLIRLYTFADDLVLDPFMGSGSTLAAAARLGRRYVGYDLDPTYVDIARERVVAAELDATNGGEYGGGEDGAAHPVGGGEPAHDPGLAAPKRAEAALERAGFGVDGHSVKVPRSGVAVTLTARDAAGRRWWFDVAGPAASHRGGLLRNEVVWRTLGRAAAVRGALRGTADGAARYVVLTTARPKRNAEGDVALRAAGPTVLFDVVDLGRAGDLDRLAAYAAGDRSGPLSGFWTDADLARADDTDPT